MARIDAGTGRIEWLKQDRGLAGLALHSMAIDRSHRVWVAKERGVYVADLPERRFRRVDEVPAVRCFAVTEGPDGEILVGATGGIFGFAEASQPPLPLEEAQLPCMRTLVVDDNSTNRRILERLLAGWGMKPTLAENGQQALASLAQAVDAHEPFALVLTDADMPEIDGFQLVEEIRKNPQLSGVTVMMLTSGGQPGDAARCRELGLAGYLTKPVGRAELLEAVLRVVGTKPTKENPHW
jgi:CheY-like chemotaxis protein